MAIKLSQKALYTTQISFCFKDERNNIPGFSGEADQLSVQCHEKYTSIYGGLGQKDTITTSIARSLAAVAIRKALELKQERVSFFVPDEDLFSREIALAAIEGAILGTYRFSKYKSEKPFTFKDLEFISTRISPHDFKNCKVLCDGVAYARDLVNENASTMTPEQLAREAQSLAKTKSIQVTVLKEKELLQQKLNLLYAVGQGSNTPPRLIFITYTGNPRSKTRTAIIGKGITFDSGGQNLKPTGSIETMRIDMAGAAAVLGTIKAAAELKLPVNITGVIPAAHNAIGQNAFFPGDVYTAYSGKTVEILSTDAEGRLVLADAISYCRVHFHPTTIIDLATLTGGVLASLADLVAGLFSNNDDLAGALFASGEKTFERLWRFPLYKEYCDSLKSDLADLRNLSKLKKGYASSIIGAAFIREFVGDTPWAHLDIAGTAFNEGAARGEIPQFGTGFGVRLLIDYFTSIA